MQINRGSVSQRSSGGGFQLNQNVLDVVGNIFRLALLATVALYGYLLWGLFSGSLADAMQPKSGVNPKQVVELIETISFWLNISVIITLVSSALLYYERDEYGVVLIIAAAFLAFGINFLLDFFFGGNADKLKAGKATAETMKTLYDTAIYIGIPGMFFFLRTLWEKFSEARKGPDLTQMTYGAGVKREKRKMPLVPAIAACWELPFCRDGIKVRCPIFHAKTKCWKEKVGCMCEENIILLAMDGGPAAPQDMTRDSNATFVPIGDLLTKSAPKTDEMKSRIPTRVGPRGIKIPTNPHLSQGQKNERCRNCIIYNEHQRLKYNVSAPVLTFAIPLLAYLQYDALRGLLASILTGLNATIAHITFTPTSSSIITKMEKDVVGNFSVEVVLIVCMTLVLMTMGLRFLEYCLFKLKI